MPLSAPKPEKAAPQVSQREAIAPDPGHTQPVIWLVGDGRSGTTWLADLINYRQNYRFMFEPLSPWSCDFLSIQDPYLYLRPQEGQNYAPKFQKIFSGQLRHSRVDQYNTSPASNQKGLLIKDILGHLCLKWVDAQFPQVKKILLLRHPFAVALSKLWLSKRQGWYWLQEPERLFAQTQLYADFLQPFADIIPLAGSNFEKQVLIWSILHYVPLVQLNQAHIHLVYYEELCTNFENEMGRLLAYLGEDQPILDERLLKLQSQPSKMAGNFSAISQQRNLIDGWTQQLTADQIDKAEYILTVFGLEQIYNGHNLRPNPEAAAYFLKTSDYGRRMVVRETQMEVDERASRFSTTIKITAYPLYDHAIPLQPTTEKWDKLGPEPTPNPVYAIRGLVSAARQSWQLRCPVAFAATWNGGPNAADIEIRLAEDATTQATFVQSYLGDGLLTFYPGYQLKTDGEHLLWMRGPLSTPKDGLYPLERVVDASMLPCTIAIDWKFTRPHQTIHFAAGEPFATLRLYPKAGLENVQVEVVQFDGGEDAYAQAFQQMRDAPTVQSFFQRLGATLTQPAEGATKPRVTDPH